MAGVAGKILQRKARTAILSDIKAIRHELALVIRDQGFKEVAAFATIKEIRKHLSDEKFDWVLMAPSASEVGECTELLVEKAVNHRQSNARISILHEHEGFRQIPNLFALGLFSLQNCAMTREAFVIAFRALEKTIRTEQGQEVNVAAHFLRSYYRTNRRYDDWVALEKRLVQTFPNNPRNLVNLGAGYLYSGQEDQGVTTMAQSVYLNPKLEKLCRDEFERFRQQRDTGIDRDQVDRMGSRKISRCLIAESDPAVRKQLTALMEEMKVPLIYTAEDGEDAWNWIKINDAPEILLTEWRLPRLSGMALIQRMRSAGHHDTTVCVVSSLVKRADLPLLNEMTVAHLITKPIQRDDAILGMRWMMRQERRPTEQKALERKINNAIAAKKLDEAEHAAAAYFANSRISDGRKTLVRAQLAYAKGDFDRATKLVQLAISQSGTDSLSTITLLGQSLLKQGNNAAALKCFEKAQSLNPQNIQRICELAELHLLEGHNTAAEDALSAARKIDAQNADVVRTEAKAAILGQTKLQDARELMMQSDARADIVSFMNNRAVALISEGKYEEACQLYQRTLETLPDSETKLSGAVYYNLGLAHARHENLPDSSTALRNALKFGSESVMQKAQSLLDRVVNSQSTGQKLVLKFGSARNIDPIHVDDPKEMKWRRIVDTVKPGGHCLLSIIDVDLRDREIAGLLSAKLGLSVEDEAA